MFNENAISKELSNNHIIFSYITCWNIDQVLLDARDHLPKEDAIYWKYTKWFVLTDIYEKMMEWKQKEFNSGWHVWIKFIVNHQFRNAILDYSIVGFKTGRKIIPKYEEPRDFFKTKEAVNKFKVIKPNFESMMNKRLKQFLEIMDR